MQVLHWCVSGCLAMARLCPNAFPGTRRWQNAREMRSPGVRRWRDCALMRSWPDWQWQYTRAVRSRVSIRGKISPRCVPGRQSVAIFSLHVSQKWPRTGKSPVRGKIRAPCVRNELALARYARHASEMPRKQPFGNTPREDPARKGHFSLHGPLESRIVRRSCHPASNSASDRSHGAALMGGGTGRGRLLVGRGDAAKGVRGVVGCRALAAKLASAKLRLQVSDADNLAES